MISTITVQHSNEISGDLPSRPQLVAKSPTVPLSKEERQTLGVLEETIPKGRGTFAETGLALAKIRDENLHLEAGYKTLGACCRGRWNLSRARAYQLINAAVLAGHLSTTSVDIAPPTNESQLRPMAGRDLDDALAIWKLANEKTSGAPVTGRLVKGAIEQLFGKPPEPVKLVKPIADHLEGVLRSCRDLANSFGDTDLSGLEPNAKSDLPPSRRPLWNLQARLVACPAGGNGEAEQRGGHQRTGGISQTATSDLFD